MPRKIDVHHHYFPHDLNKKVASAAVGFRTPPEHLPWTPQVSLNAMDALGVDLAILSVPANYAAAGAGSREKACAANEAMAAVCVAHPGRFAFWACLGDWRDVDDALDIIVHALDELKAVGVAVSSCYGTGPEAKYIGDEMFGRIWSELDRRAAIVFLHGAQMPAATPMPHPALGIPITEAPHETFKAIAHLIVSGTTTRHRRVTLILAHMGGSTLALAHRVAALSAYMGAPLTEEGILDEFRRCWWDCALSGTTEAAQAFGVGKQVVWGSDFPAVPLDAIRWFDVQLEDGFPKGERERLEGISYANILDLFSSHDILLGQPTSTEA
ncbi:hypothetical protein K488DRAFT_77449 [Vararia minispora EC-137]|uniref:Uncharacterized protein n=1 Tax=Vararia minispora EC-137 TaxID=1314806 RepID=A0ACB8QRS6_9AGAM|nr:hypothetical protein K488DRAFT_77449 [Vararia minispora EC-137]